MKEALVRLTAKRIEHNFEGKTIPENYGLCSKCENFYYRRTSLMDIETKCNHYHPEGTRPMKTQPRSYDPVIECSGFYQRGQMSLRSMQDFAWIIDVEKRKIGFVGEENKVIITEPKESGEIYD